MNIDSLLEMLRERSCLGYVQHWYKLIISIAIGMATLMMILITNQQC